MKKTLGIAAATLITCSALSACSVDTETGSAGGGGGGGTGDVKQVVYKVYGPTKKASITYTDGGTKTSQDTEASIPWSKKVPTKDSAIVYQVMAQNMGPASKVIKCQITTGKGKVLDSNVAKGQYAIAQCQWNPNE